MDPNRWRKIDDLFHAALDSAPRERERLLNHRCANDVGLRREIESLLAAHKGSSHIIDSRAFEVASRTRTPNEPHRLTGGMIGHYRICGFIGAGGGGAVYEAEQDNPRRTIALKLMRALPYRDKLTARLFRREGQALARLQHACIAAIYEAGQTDDGWHYFAMERVTGAPLMQYVREQELPLRARLALFKLICDAVHYAHQRGVIHRDLKPSNILVTPEGQPKVLDFGLARIMDSEGDATQLSITGAFQGTIAYSSPEQVRGKPDDIDARSDVYSLGVILFEMSTDKLPYETNGATLADASRLVCEKTPRLAGSIRRALRGDIETIAGKALEKEPGRRYASAAALGEDVERHLNHQPILARSSGTIYQFRKFVGRNRVASGVVGALLIGLVALATVNGWLASRYAEQRDTATLAASEERVARRSADEVVKFLESVLAGADPFTSREKQPTLADVVSQAESRLAELNDEPLVQARVMTALGGVYIALAKYDRAIDLFDRALAIRTAELRDEHPDIAATLDSQCSAYSAAGQHEQAIAAASKSLAIIEKARGRDHLETAASLTSLGTAQFNARAFDGAIARFEEALAIRRRLLGDDHLDVADALANLGSTYREAGRISEAVPLLRQCLQIRESRLGDSPGVCEALQNLAHATFATDLEETRRLVERQLAVARRVYHAKHPVVANALNDLGFLVRRADAAAACDLYAEALAIRRESLGQDHPLVAESLNELGILLSNRGDLAAAERCLAEALEIRRKHFGPRDVHVSHSMNSLADTYRKEGRLDEAAELAEGVLDIWLEIYGSSHAMVGVAHQNAGAIYAELKDWDRAEEHLRNSADIYSKLEHPNLCGPLQILGTMNLSRGRFDVAESYLRRALEVVRARPAPIPMQAAPVLNCLGVVLNLLDRPREACVALEDSLRFYRQALAPGDAALFRPLVDLAEVQMSENEQADPALFDELLAIEPKLGPDDDLRGNLLALRGQQALSNDCPGEAIVFLSAALKIHEAKWGSDHWRTAITRAWIGQALLRSGDLDAARKSLSAAARVLNDTLGPSHPTTAIAVNELSEVTELATRLDLQNSIRR